MLRATTPRAFSASQRRKVFQDCHFLTFLASKCASRHNAAPFFNISTSKSAQNALFFTFWLPNVLPATAPCTFSTSLLRKVLRAWGAFDIWLLHVLRTTTTCNSWSLIWPNGSAPAALASLLFDPPELQNIGKTQFFPTFLPVRAPASSFFWLYSSLIFFLILFSSLTLPTSALSSVHIVGSLTSKLPSAIIKIFLTHV